MKNLNLQITLAATTILMGSFGMNSLLNNLEKKNKVEKYTHIYQQTSGNYYEELPEFAQKGIDYLAKVQFENGSWGAGTHTQQNVIDATQVQSDPATTAFAAMALLRAGNTLKEGKYSENLNKAVLYLLGVIENASEEGNKITDISGTQPQIKLGQNIDASMCVQFLIRIAPHAKHDKSLETRISNATDKCLRKIQKTQAEDGSINGGGWAPVLQSAMATNALELADNAGKDVDKKALEKSKNYQKDNIDTKTGEIKAERGAGVALYSVAGNQRSTATEARKATDLIAKGKKEGKLANDAPVTLDNLKQLNISDEEASDLVQAYNQNQGSISQMKNDQVLAGFGNNGGEEFLSFMLTSESLVITGGKDWDEWKDKMHKLLSGIQNNDGSWNGHHCITSPVFCTAASILALSVENDKDLLLKK
jgi:hypothetical protein